MLRRRPLRSAPKWAYGRSTAAVLVHDLFDGHGCDAAERHFADRTAHAPAHQAFQHAGILGVHPGDELSEFSWLVAPTVSLVRVAALAHAMVDLLAELLALLGRHPLESAQRRLLVFSGRCVLGDPLVVLQCFLVGDARVAVLFEAVGKLLMLRARLGVAEQAV